MTGLSLNEVDALAKKACRGARYPWGLAEDAGRAVRWLAAHRLPGMSVLADLLQMQDGIDLKNASPVALDGLWTAPSGTICPLVCGAALSDCAHLLGPDATVEISSLVHPLLVLPFAAQAARHNRAAVQISWGGVRIATDGTLIWRQDQGDLTPASHVDVTCRGLSRMPGQGHPPGQRVETDAAAWDRLSRFAHRTYAPATEASRQRGAGAGATDND